MDIHPLIRIIWIILIGIILISIKRIFDEKGWRISNFIRIEDDDDESTSN